MKFLLPYLLLILLLAGCNGNKKPLQHMIDEETITHTKKGVIVDETLPKAHIIATHLSDIEEYESPYESFVIGLYFEDEEESLENGDYRLVSQRDTRNDRQVRELNKSISYRAALKDSDTDRELTRMRKDIKRLSELNPKSLVKLESDDKLLDFFPSKNNWNSYYKVEFDKTDLPTVNLTLEHQTYGSMTIVFQKDILTR
jgi:hypothetical protein